MIRQLNILILSLLLSSCFSGQERLILKENQDNRVPLDVSPRPFSMLDTIERYSRFDTLLDYGSNRVFAGDINGIQFGIIGVSDTTTYLCQISSTAISIDTLNTSFLDTQLLDVNFDRNLDLVIRTFITGSGGNSEVEVFLFDVTNEKFVYNSTFSLPNIKVDGKTRMLFSAWWSAGGRPHTKKAFKVLGDSLNFLGSVVYFPEEDKVIFFEKVNGLLVETRIIQGDKSWKIFNESFWDTSEEFE